MKKINSQLKTHPFTQGVVHHQKTVFLIIGVVLISIAQISLKLGSDPESVHLNYLETIAINFSLMFIVFGLCLYAFSSILWLYILKQLPLSLAYPTMGTSYILVVLASNYFFTEPLTFYKIIGVFFILSGVKVLYSK